MKNDLLGQAAAVVDDLNDKIFDKVGDCRYSPLSVLSNGYQVLIKWFDTVLWDSDNEDRAFDDNKNEYEPLKDFVIMRCHNLADAIKREATALTCHSGGCSKYEECKDDEFICFK